MFFDVKVEFGSTCNNGIKLIIVEKKNYNVIMYSMIILGALELQLARKMKASAIFTSNEYSN
jgi:hypothetical protein